MYVHIFLLTKKILFMPRSLYKGPFSLPFGRAQHVPDTGKIQVWSRQSCILPSHVGLLVSVHTGRVFVPVRITEDMVGHKFGEFASTRKKGVHKKKGKK